MKASPFPPLWAVLTLLAVNLPAAAAATFAPAAASPTAAAPAAVTATAQLPRAMAHHWGVGLDYIPGASASLQGAFAQLPNAVAARWCVSNRVSVDMLMALNYSSLATGGNASTGSVNAYGVGFNLKYAFSEPNRFLQSQVITKASYALADQPSTGPGSSGTGTLATTAVFAGVGFEAFVPGWDWLSLEGSAGLSLNTQVLKPSSAPTTAQATQSTSTVTLGGNGFSPVNVALHVYF